MENKEFEGIYSTMSTTPIKYKTKYLLTPYADILFTKEQPQITV